ncbi:DUF6292 family protein [Streptomyces tubercidicus]
MAQSFNLADALERAIGYYMASVADKLLAEGLPVSSISAYGRYDDEDQKRHRDDVEGTIRLNDSFMERVLPDAESGLAWSGTSGWCLWTLPRKSLGGVYDGARWLGAGLLPSPDQVASFVSSIQLDVHNSGSSDRPFYRDLGQGLTELHNRLREFTPVGDAFHPRYEYVFDKARDTAYYDRMVNALASGDDEIVNVPMRKGELTALAHLLEFAEGSSHMPVRIIADRLSKDVAQRSSGDAGVRDQQRARLYAYDVISRREEARLRKEDGGE